jgi:hypothetical protein
VLSGSRSRYSRSINAPMRPFTTCVCVGGGGGGIGGLGLFAIRLYEHISISIGIGISVSRHGQATAAALSLVTQKPRATPQKSKISPTPLPRLEAPCLGSLYHQIKAISAINRPNVPPIQSNQIKSNQGNGPPHVPTLGLGRKKASCAKTSETSCWWPRTLRVFMMRTMAASMAMDRSSCLWM